MVVTITGCSLEKMRGADTPDGKKPVFYFDRIRRAAGWCLVKPVAGQLVEVTGERDSSQWVDKRVELFVTQTQSPDGIVDCIRVRKPSTPTPAKRRQRRRRISTIEFPSDGRPRAVLRGDRARRSAGP